MESASLWDSDVLRAVLGNAALAPVFPLIALALALGILLRSTAAAIVAVFALIFAPPFLGELLPRWFQEDVLSYLPGDASDAIALGHLEGAADGLSPGIASVMVVAWLAAFLGAARGWRSSAATPDQAAGSVPSKTTSSESRTLSAPISPR